MGMAWCKVSSLTAAVSRTLRAERFPLSKAKILEASAGKTVEGWELSFFLGKSLRRRSYPDLRAVMSDLETWLDAQG